MEVEEAIQKLGAFGKWHASVYFLILISLKLPCVWNISDIVVLAYKPPHHCKIPVNSSVEEWIPSDTSGKLSSCFIFVNSSNQTITCVNGWTYDVKESGPTIATKWDLVCDRSYIIGLSQVLFFVGMALGGISTSRLADKYGRKWVLILNVSMESVLGIASILVTRLELFMFFRMFLGFFTGAGILCKVVYLLESFSLKSRHNSVIMEHSAGGIIMALLFPVAYLLASWIYVQLFLSIYPVIFLPILMWWLPETVPWLHANNRIEEAENVLLFAGKMNNITFTRPILKPLEDDSKMKQLDEKNDEDEQMLSGLIKGKYRTFDENNQKNIGFIANIKKRFKIKNTKRKVVLKTQYSILELVRNKYLLRHMTWAFVLFFSNLLYFSIIYITGSLSTNRFLDGFLNAIIEFPACIFIAFALYKYGIKYPVILCFFISGIAMFACIVSASYESQSMAYSYVTLTFLVVSKCFGGASYAVIFFYGNELFPINIRQQASSICLLVGRMGAILAAFAPLCIENNPRILYACLGISCLLVSLFTMFLPETSNRALPETVEDIEAWYKEDAVDVGVKNVSDKYKNDDPYENKENDEDCCGNEINDTKGSEGISKKD